MTIVTRAAKGSALTYAEVDGNFTTPVTIGSTAIQLGQTTTTLAGLDSVTLTGDPTAALQAATKQYVDAVAEGLHVHAACAVAINGPLSIATGGTVTYNNGAAGVGATLTLSIPLTAVGGYTLQNGDRVLVKDEATQAHNGIYTWATGGTVLTRATDFDTAAEIASGDFTFVTYGTRTANTGWVQTTPMVTVGTTPITFIQFSGAGTYTAGTGLTLTGTQFSLTAPVTAALGGTGQTSYTNGDLLYASSASTLSKLGIGTANQVLTSSGTAPQWSSSLTLSGLTLSGLTAGRVPFATTGGQLTDSANLTFDGTTLNVQNMSVGLGGGNDPDTVAIGADALVNNVGGITNVAIGYGALKNNTNGSDNVAIGFESLLNNDRNYNVGLGEWSLRDNTLGSDNVALGPWALLHNIDGSQNVAVGSECLSNNTSGNNNTAFGLNAGIANTTGSYNTFFGTVCGANITTGSYNTFIGAQADMLFGATAVNHAVAIGADAKVSTSDTVVLGRPTDTTVIGYTGIQTGRTEQLQVAGSAFFAGGISGGTF